MTVRLIQRKPFETQFSVESYFSRVVEAFEALDFDAELRIVPRQSKGLPALLEILRFAWSHQGDVTHVTGDIQFAALVTRGKRSVLTVLDCGSLERLSGIRRMLMKELWYRRPCRRVAAITVISSETKRQLLRHVPSIPPEKVHVVPVSVSDLYRPDPRPLNLQKPRILQVGTKVNKNLPRLIAALADLPCTLAIVGRLDPVQEKALEKARIEVDNLVGISDAELAAEYARADIVSFTSTYEGFGMPIVEAQQTRRPVITSNCSSMPEVAGDGALLVDPFSVAEIRGGLERLMSSASLCQELVERGAENAKRFDKISIAKQYIEIYRRVAQT